MSIPLPNTTRFYQKRNTLIYLLEEIAEKYSLRFLETEIANWQFDKFGDSDPDSNETEFHLRGKENNILFAFLQLDRQYQDIKGTAFQQELCSDVCIAGFQTVALYIVRQSLNPVLEKEDERCIEELARVIRLNLQLPLNIYAHVSKPIQVARIEENEKNNRLTLYQKLAQDHGLEARAVEESFQNINGRITQDYSPLTNSCHNVKTIIYFQDHGTLVASLHQSTSVDVSCSNSFTPAQTAEIDHATKNIRYPVTIYKNNEVVVEGEITIEHLYFRAYYPCKMAFVQAFADRVGDVELKDGVERVLQLQKVIEKYRVILE